MTTRFQFFTQTILLLFSIIPVVVISAQDSLQENFRLVYLSNNINTEFSILERKVATVKSVKELQTLVRQTIQDTVGCITVRFVQNRQYYWWKKDFGKKREEQSGWIMLGKRDISIPEIQELSSLPKFFKKHLVIADIAEVRLNFHDNRPLSNYLFIRYSCSTNRMDSVSLSLSDYNKLFITASCFFHCDSTNINYILFTTTNPSLPLASGVMSFIDQNLKTELKNVANNIINTVPNISIAEVADYLQGYLSAFYGDLIGRDSKRWLIQNCLK